MTSFIDPINECVLCHSLIILLMITIHDSLLKIMLVVLTYDNL